MTKVLVLYYSSYGHIEQMAYAVAEGRARSTVSRPSSSACRSWCPRTSPSRRHQARPAGAGGDAKELADYDAIIVGTPTRFGNMAAQMRNFWTRPAAIG